MSSKGDDQQFAETVLEAFQAAGRYTDVEVAEAGGPSSSWMTELRKIRDGAKQNFDAQPRSDTLRRIDAAANWRQGSARKLLFTGTLPAERETVTPMPQDDPLAINTRKPDWMSDEQWAQILRDHEDHLRYLLDKAARER